MIKIGVTACFLYVDANRVSHSAKELCYLEKDMARYLSRDHVLPILIPDLPKNALDRFIAEVDGIVLQGGDDISPQSYGRGTFDPRWPGDFNRDQYELYIVKQAIQQNKPVFAICRGFQLLNVFFKGTLIQDITTELSKTATHKNKEIYDQCTHDIQFTRGQLLDRLFSNETVRKVNSIHHQCIDKLGNDLEILAVCPEDQMIEAIGWTGAPEGKVMGVQWHPEFFYNYPGKLIDADIIYHQFLTHCKK